MSLLYWLPMLGTLENQGLSAAQPVNHGATVGTSGKLGKCYDFSGTAQYIDTGFKESFGTGDFSISVWFKLTDSGSRTYQPIISNKTTGAASVGCAIYYNHSQQKFLWSTADGSGATEVWMAQTYSYSGMLNTWHHIVMVRNSSDAKKGYFYIDGVRYELASVPAIRNVTNTTYNLQIGDIGSHNNANYLWTGSLCDVRVYDHALSAREAKELSKGLVLHYPLSGIGKENFVDTTKTFPVGGTGRMQNIENGVKTLGVDADTYFNIPLKTALTQGTTYTLSFHATDVPSGSRLTFGLGAQSTSHASHCGIVDVHGGYNTFTFTPGANFSNQIIMDDTYRTGLPIVEMTYFKIEEGDAATPWIPSSNDSRYSVVGSDESIIYDVSGYGHNGTRLGALTYSSDTTRYTMSANFNGTDSGILIENLPLSNVINTAVTYSFWIKPSGENGGRSVYFGSYSGTSWSIEKTTGNIIRGYWNGSPDVGYSGATITDGIWQHVCITKNGTSDIKVYINGVLKATSTATHSALTFPTTYRIGRDVRSNDGTPYKGLMSDFRIYATTLSADDVMELYHTPITLSSNGTLLTQGEYSEV